jgi:cysteine desulfurase/selenocysteine lyase
MSWKRWSESELPCDDWPIMSSGTLVYPIPPDTAPAFDVELARKDFPILSRRMGGKPLVYLDSAATAQKPQAVIDAVSRFYAFNYASVHRGVYRLSEEATVAYEGVREKVAGFLNASSAQEVIFTRGTTDSINLVAQSYGRRFLRPGDEILLTWMEHHSNIVPWQLVAEQTGAVIRAVPITDIGELDLEQFEAMLSHRTRLVSLVHVSNALGTVNPVKQITGMAHSRGIPVVVDGAQSAPHLKVDVRDLDCDFYAFSGHKLYGPTGVGVLYGRASLLNTMPPCQGGGGMIQSVTFEGSSWAPPPARFEAGTPMISEVIGLGAALDYVSSVGRSAVVEWEHQLVNYATETLHEVPGLKLIGTAKDRAGVISFILQGVHPHDIATILDDEGIAIRGGHHCAQPVMDRFHVPGTARLSIALYNTYSEIDVAGLALHRVAKMFG